MKTYLTGIKPTGVPHIGNLLGAILPAIQRSQEADDVRCLYFIADYHALTSVREPKAFQEDVYNVAATWLAFGLDPKKVIFYRQSDVPEIFELAWILSCFAPKGDLNRAHSYKDRVQKNIDSGKDPDLNINMGLFNYPILMASDILIFDTNFVPVGKDQKQHVEIARSIASRFNEINKTQAIVEPQELIGETGAYVPGLDGRKMSKSYDNSIELWLTEKKLKKTINKIVTDSTPPEEPKDPENNLIMDFYKLFANEEQIAALSDRYRQGIGWGEAKAELFEVVNEFLKGPREKYNYLMENKHEIDELLDQGAKEARAIAKETLKRVRKACIGG